VAAEGGFIGVGENRHQRSRKPLWTDQQLGVHEVVKEMKAAGPVGVMEALLEREDEKLRLGLFAASA